VKRVDLVRHREAHGFRRLREDGGHSIYVQEQSRNVSTVPRHREVKDFLARKICKVLDIPAP
jgi:predicted RNA binding protein YcfA (HicA-like mRNA interferase family)